MDCLRRLLLDFFDFFDGCLCYSTKMGGGGDKAQRQAFAEVMSTLNRVLGWETYTSWYATINARIHNDFHIYVLDPLIREHCQLPNPPNDPMPPAVMANMAIVGTTQHLH